MRLVCEKRNEKNGAKRRAYQEIVIAGLDLVIRKGYAVTKAIDIAKEAHISGERLFHYFPTKVKLPEALTQSGVSAPTIIFSRRTFFVQNMILPFQRCR